MSIMYGVKIKNNINIYVKNFNDVVMQPELLKKLRRLTLNHFSGMNYELNNFEKISKVREVKCKILMAYINNELAGWALLSREPSSYYFSSLSGYDPTYGILFQVYVSFPHRRQGVGSELLKVARRKAGPYKLCICPHDTISNLFFDKFKNYHYKKL